MYSPCIIEALDDDAGDVVPTPLLAQAVETREELELLQQPEYLSGDRSPCSRRRPT